MGHRWYRSLFQIATNPIVVLDRNGVVLMINQAGARNLGLPAAEIIGMSLRDLLPDIFERIVGRYRRVIDHGESMQVEDEVPLPSGTRWFWSTLEPVRDALGQVCAVQVIS